MRKKGDLDLTVASGKRIFGALRDEMLTENWQDFDEEFRVDFITNGVKRLKMEDENGLVETALPAELLWNGAYNG